MTLTPEQRANLEKLASYLEALPADYSHFDMEYYVSGFGPERAVAYARKNGGVCGTSACAIGHGPAAGILVPEHCIYADWGDEEVEWDDYAEAMFVGGVFQAGRDWSFGGHWDAVDNSHYGAAARIRYLLANGNPPADYSAPSAEFLSDYAPYRIDAKAPAA